jgi:predicted AlkP superfamily pyrophosphatase or phosphodiesterase
MTRLLRQSFAHGCNEAHIFGMRIRMICFAAVIAARALDAQQQSSAPAADAPTLVVMITIDGFREGNLDKFGPQLTGGLARLTRNGAWFTNAHQDHAITETAPGHASMLSGRFPRSTGIAANRVGVADAAYPLLGKSGVPGASPSRFQGTALFDWMHQKNPLSRALSVSSKDRGAILPVGRARQQVYWYPGDGAFTTSRYYRDALPGWVTDFNNRRLPQSYAGRAWTLVLPDSAYREPDSVSIEGAGNDFVFPHQIPADPQRAANWIRGTPFIDEVTVAFALAGVNAMQLGKGPAPDLLAISLSATDAINHRLGPDSREAHDQVIRTDRIIGVLLDSLYRLRDSSKVIVVLSADHGFTTIPELASPDVLPQPTRTNLDAALASARARLKELKMDTLDLDTDEQIVLVDRAAFARVNGSLQSVLDAFVKTALLTPGIRRVDRLESLRTSDTLSDPIARRWTHQFGPGTNVELVATLDPGSLWTWLLVASHGSPYDIDSHVPIIFYGPAFVTGKFGEFVRSVDIAPTLARVLRVVPAEPLDGVPLARALK